MATSCKELTHWKRLCKIEHEAKQKERTSEIKAKIAEVKRFNDGVEKENAKIKREYDEAIENRVAWEKRLQFYEERREGLLKRRDEAKARLYTEETCAYCGQELPYEMLEKAREKFNETKAKDLELIVKEGKQTAEDIVKAKEKIESLSKTIEEGYTLLEKQDISALEEILAKVESTFVIYEDTVEHDEIFSQMAALEKELKEIPSNDNYALTSEKKTLIDTLAELSKKLGLKDEIGKVESEIIELKKELRSVANSIAELEGIIFKCKEYEQEKNNLVSLRINEKLEHSKIEMFSTQKNGDVVPDCVLTNARGVKFNSTNGADRIAINLDLQKLFMRHFDIAMPIWVDESSIFDSNHLPSDSNYKFVYLFASDSPTLCVE